MCVCVCELVAPQHATIKKLPGIKVAIWILTNISSYLHQIFSICLGPAKPKENDRKVENFI